VGGWDPGGGEGVNLLELGGGGGCVVVTVDDRGEKGGGTTTHLITQKLHQPIPLPQLPQHLRPSLIPHLPIPKRIRHKRRQIRPPGLSARDRELEDEAQAEDVAPEGAGARYVADLEGDVVYGVAVCGGGLRGVGADDFAGEGRVEGGLAAGEGGVGEGEGEEEGEEGEDGGGVHGWSMGWGWDFGVRNGGR